jgi:hypothetical protein
MRRWTLLFGTLAFTVATFGTAIAQPRDLPDGPNRDVVSRRCQVGGDNYLGRSATIILAGRVGRERQL